MYTYQTTVRYSEAAFDTKVRPHQIINYLQDCSILDSEHIGKGVSFFDKYKRAWVISAWQIEIDEYPAFKQELTVGTWPYDFSNLYGFRNFTIQDETGKQIVRANSLWCLIDMETGGPAKITEADISGYELQEKLPMEEVSRKLKILKEGEKPEPFLVRKSDLDTNRHVNNARYIAMAEEYLPDDFLPKKFRVQYRKQAMLGDRIYPLVHEDENVYAIALCDEDYKPYVSVEFAKESE